MCEINPKKKRLYKLEFFTTKDMTENDWYYLVMEKLLKLEQKFNERGDIRVHVHELND